LKVRSWGPPNLERRAARRGVGDDAVDKCRNVSDGNEIDPVLTVPEDKRTARAPGRLLQQLKPQLQEGRRTHDRPRRFGHPEVLLGGVLHPEELHRVVGARANH